MYTTSWLRPVTLVSAILAAILVGRPAAACPCPGSVAGMVPPTSASGVPINTKVTVYADRTQHVQDIMGTSFLTDSSLKLDLRYQGTTPMDKIAGSTVRVSVGGITTWYRFDPDQGTLPPGVVISVYATDTTAVVHKVGELTTGAAEDKTAPTFAGLTSFEATLDRYPSGSDCVLTNPIARAFATAGSATDDSTAAGSLRYELYFYKNGTTAPTVPLVVLMGGAADVELVQSSAKCGVASFNSDIIAGVKYCARVRVVDGAGNWSDGMVETCTDGKTRTVDASGQPTTSTGGGGSGGCSHGGGAPSTLGIALVLLGIGLLRRQR